MTDLNDDILSILDADEPGTLVLVAPTEGFEIDDESKLNIIVSKSSGDGVIVSVDFDDSGVQVVTTPYADNHSGQRRQAFAPRT